MTKDSSLHLRRANSQDCTSLELAFNNSRDLHQPWSYPPHNYQDYIQAPHLYLLCLKESQQIVGIFNISEVVRGSFHSAYLGYQVFTPHANKGYMSQGLQLLIAEAFSDLKLHRLEANIQPGNTASKALVKKAGFQLEGFSPQYLQVGGEWKDHERWAIINHHWPIKQ